VQGVAAVAGVGAAHVQRRAGASPLRAVERDDLGLGEPGKRLGDGTVAVSSGGLVSLGAPFLPAEDPDVTAGGDSRGSALPPRYGGNEPVLASWEYQRELSFGIRSRVS
jgi:hypothetical protein